VRDFNDRVAVKVCGVTNLDDALSCAATGVDMLGLNFSPQSRRCISLAVAREIVSAVRGQYSGIEFVGIFVDQDSEFVRATAAELALDAVQLHGDESPHYARDLNASFVIKALRIGGGYSAARATDCRCDAILLDTWSASEPGGTGETFPWSIAAALRSRVNRLILAGGLTCENVAEAIRLVRPFAVDVCSGVEDAAGRKDPAKVRRFVEGVRAVECAPADLPA
jgi:phosphoribosylanthranilate isomerase